MERPLIVVCITTVARRASAERATATFSRHHPEAIVRRVVVDDLIVEDGARFVETLFALREFARLAMLHDGPALVAAVRPSVVRSIAQLGSGCILVLPDDAEVFGRVDPLLAPIDGGAAVALLVNRFSPPPSDGQLPDSIDVAERGRLDQELFAVRGGDTRAEDFLDKWVSSLIRSPHIPPSRLDPTTYPWLDSLGELDGVVSIADATMPLSVRNADEPSRQVPPTVVRWPGFDPATPWILSTETGTLPRIRPSNHPRLAALSRDRAEALLFHHDDGRVGGFAHLGNGLAVDSVIRHAYVNALLRFESGNADEPPNPFAGDTSATFLAWITSPRGHEPSPFFEAFRGVHPELVDALPTADALLAWLTDRGAAAGIPRALRMPEGRPAAIIDVALGPGLAISGYIGANFGMGEAARSLVRSANEAGITTRVTVDPRSVYHEDLDATIDPTADPSRRITPATYVTVRNADALLADPSDALAARAAGQRVIGYWFWEVARFPDRLRPAFTLVDEIWVATEFVAGAIRSAPGSPAVRVLPYPLPEPVDATERARLRNDFTRAHMIADDRFVVSFSFDYDSVADRKNPWGAVEAYRRAFPEEGIGLVGGRVPLLVLKAIGAERHPIDHDRLRHAIGDRTDVVLLERRLEPDQQRGLFARTDTYLSLHRGEGLGLTIAEAMSVGCPVVCTGYGGNMSFCTDETVFIVPHTLIDIPPVTPVYATCGQWAEPDVLAAAAHLRTIADQPTIGPSKARAAERHLAELHGTRSTALHAFLTERAAHGEPPPPTEDHPMPETPPAPGTPGATNSNSPPPTGHPGLGAVVLPGAPMPDRTAGSGVLGAVAGRVRSTVEPMIAAQAAFEQSRIIALVDAVQQTRQAVLDLEANARAERQTLTEAIGGVATHTSNLQSNHDSLYASVTELSTQVRTLSDSHLDLHHAISRIDQRLDALTADLRFLLERLPRSS